MATGSILLQVQSGKLGGPYITTSARHEGGAGIWKTLFAAGQTEQAIYQFEAPVNYASNPVQKLKYAMASAIADKVDLESEVMAITDGEDVDTASFDSVNEIAGGTTVPGTAGDRDTIELPLTNNDSMSAEETGVIRNNRDHDDGDDTASGDLELVGNVFEYDT